MWGGVKLLENTYKDLKYYIEYNSKYDILKILNDNTPAETKIFLFSIFNLLGFCKLNWNILSENEVYNLMKKYFYIFDVNELSPYIVKSSAVGEIKDYKKFVKKDTHLYLKYFKDIDALSPKNSMQQWLFKLLYRIKKVLL